MREPYLQAERYLRATTTGITVLPYDREVEEEIARDMEHRLAIVELVERARGRQLSLYLP